MLLGFLLAFSSVLIGQVREGSIRGTVLGDNGAAVAGAHVSVDVMEGSRVLTGLDATTDEFGAFSITGLAAGEYRVSAEKREVGYLSTRPDIFNAKQPLTIVLTPDTPVVTAIIRFRAKAATITGWVRDSVTGMPIAAHLSLGPADGSGWSGTGTTARFKFSLQIPADTPVNFGACAEGYKLWSHADPSDLSRPVPIQLGPGTQLEIDIYLERTWENEPTPCFSCKF